MFKTDRRGVMRLEAWSRHAWLRHGFTTRKTGDFREWPSEPEIASAFDADGFGICALRQVHGLDVSVADHAWGTEGRAADAAVTDRPFVLVGVRTADCVPILLVDPVRRSVAAVHAGWRGAVAGIVQQAVSVLRVEYGSLAGDIECALGPCIGACCFEVGEEVAAKFPESVVDRSRRKPHVDLRAHVQAQLRSAGVGLITAVGECTQCNLDRYASHRGQGGSAGRMLAVAGIRSDLVR
ncbi:MAG: peptidoglycan editing factor PgeF [Bryobacterales bacterium]|nr:peptidoglycan editing factor PgeF [Bryobacterales bacterium]